MLHRLSLMCLLGIPLSLAGVRLLPAVDIPLPEKILKTLKKGHPRLLATDERFAELRERLKTDTQLKAWHADLQRAAERILERPPPMYDIPDGLRLLSTSRRVLRHVYTLALLHRLDGEKRHVDRAWTELRAAADFKDWNPRHFLDTAEMTHAFAIGYDWLHGEWTESQRELIREAIVTKGLHPARAAYRGKARHGWWVGAVHNWNQVCNGGVGMGALALGEVEAELAGEVLHEALRRLPAAMTRFAPDGAWDEGPGYWRYATEYNVVILAALATALGNDFGLSAIDGFSEAGAFPIYVTGPLKRTFNFADGGASAIRAPHMFWLARRFDRPEYATYARRMASPHPLDVVWEDAGRADAAGLPLDKYFRGAEVATFRSRWDDDKALFVALKGGDNKANHSNLDLGTFVLDALGKRWALDLGADNYNLPGYWSSGKSGTRWTYYRMRAEGHNTVLVNPGRGPDQDPSGAAKIVRFQSSPARAFGIVNLTAAYAEHASRVERGVLMAERRRVLIQDEIKCRQAADVWWCMHTPASVSLESGGTEARLAQGDVALRARIRSPDGARFREGVAEPLPSSPHPPRQRRNRGVKRLTIHLEDTREVRLVVELLPELGEAVAQPAAVKPLSDW